MDIYEMSTSVDSKSVLQALNSIGYQGISAEELKVFTKDLKKLIKYDTQPKCVREDIRAEEKVENVKVVKTPHHTEDRIKDDRPKKTKNCGKRPRSCEDKACDDVEPKRHDPDQKPKSQQPSRPTSTKKTRPTKKTVVHLTKHTAPMNTNIVYKTVVKCGGKLVRNTAGDLHKKYQEDWNKFKKQGKIPGESSRQDLRNKVHKKMQHKMTLASKVYVCFEDECED